MICYRCGRLMLGQRARLANGYMAHFACAVELSGQAASKSVNILLGRP